MIEKYSSMGWCKKFVKFNRKRNYPISRRAESIDEYIDDFDLVFF